MPEVKLVLTVDNTQYIGGVRDAQKATENLHKAAVEGTRREKGLIQDIEDEMNRLQKVKKEAWKIEDIEKYNRKLAEAKKDLQDYETVGLQANQKIEKSGTSLISSIGKWALGFATVSAAIGVFKSIIESTDTLSDKFAATLSGWKSGFAAMARAIANREFKDFFKNVKEAVTEGQRYVQTEQQIGDAARAVTMRIDENETAIKKLKEIQASKDKSDKERLDAGLEADRLTKQNAKDRLKLAEMTLANEMTNAAFVSKQSEQTIKNYLKQEPVLMRQIGIGQEYNKLISDRARLENMQITVMGKTAGMIANEIEQRDKAKARIDEKIKAMGSEAIGYGELAKGLGNILDVQKDKIVSDKKAIESAKQTAIDLRISSRNDALIAKETKDIIKDKLKTQEEYQKKAEKLLDDYNKSQIESLTGTAKLAAQREFGIKQIKEIRDQIAKLGPITDDQNNMLQAMADNVWKIYYTELAKQAKIPQDQKDAVSKALLGNIPEMPGLIKRDVEKARKDIELTIATNKKFNVWSLIGIDTETEEGRDQAEILKQAANNVKNIIDDVYEKRVADAQRERELIDTRIAETQRSLELETQLMEDGFANNVTAKQKELADLQKVREQALKDEEKARKTQAAIETVLQTVNLITASSEIFKTFSKIPVVGIPLAIAMIATMFGAFAAAKMKAKTSATELAEGGSGTETGIVTGKKHSQGGEKFLDHIEIERGEAWGVLSRGATNKFGDVFHNMVSSFNKGELPEIAAPVVSNYIDNSESNSRLDKVIAEQKRMNKRLEAEQVTFSGGKKIIKRGNLIRIVRQ